MDEEISCEKKQGYDVISSAEATLGDEEPSDKGESLVQEGKFLVSLSCGSGILGRPEHA